MIDGGDYPPIEPGIWAAGSLVRIQDAAAAGVAFRHSRQKDRATSNFGSWFQFYYCCLSSHLLLPSRSRSLPNLYADSHPACIRPLCPLFVPSAMDFVLLQSKKMCRGMHQTFIFRISASLTRFSFCDSTLPHSSWTQTAVHTAHRHILCSTRLGLPAVCSPTHSPPPSPGSGHVLRVYDPSAPLTLFFHVTPQ